MSLIYREGDLLQQDECEIICHQANCKKTLGNRIAAGIARAIGEIYPDAAEADLNWGVSPTGRLGKFSMALTTGSNGLTKRVYNLYGQYNPGRNTDYEALASALILMIEDTKDKKEKLAVPYMMGCGIGGGDWRIVESILETLSESYNRDIYVYKLPGV